MKQESPQRNIGTIGNYYGALYVKSEAGQFYWSIEDYDGHQWEEIPEELFDELNKFQDGINKGGIGKKHQNTTHNDS